MNKILDTFTFDERLNEEYVNELQIAFDRLEELLNTAHKYSNDREDTEEYPIWEYVNTENSDTLLYLLTELLTYKNEDNSGHYSAIVDFVMSKLED